MRIHALAVDFDGTIATQGRIAPATLEALEAVRRSGRRVILVTGRQYDDLIAIDPDLRTFDAVVADNGGVLFLPHTKEILPLAEEPPDELGDELEKRGVPFERGRTILSTHTPHELTVLEAIRDLGLEYDLTFNKGAVMVLPAGVNKRSGLLAALDRLQLSIHNTAGIGDAENDHAFLGACEVSAAVANALPALKDRADIVVKKENGRGVVELIERYVLNDFETAPELFRRHTVEVGVDRAGDSVRVRVHQGTLLLVGSSKAGKSKLSGALVERLIDQGYQVCVIDPEGEYVEISPLIIVGNERARPSLEEVKAALVRSPAGVAVNIVALSRADKIQFAPTLLSMVLGVRAELGRPHWIVVDEAHHLFPHDATPAAEIVPSQLERIFMVTLSPERVATPVLERVSTLFVMGEGVKDQVERFATRRDAEAPKLPKKLQSELMEGEVLMLPVKDGKLEKPVRFEPTPRRSEHRRHLRKYAAGDLGVDGSFYFRGPSDRLNLRAFNVSVFAEMARGVDDETWQFHLARGDYSSWFKDVLKSKKLSKEAQAIEEQADRLSPAESRGRIVQLIEQRYTVG